MRTGGHLLGSLVFAAYLIGAQAHAQHVLDNLLDPGGPSKPRETSKVDSSVAEKADSADDDLRRRVNDTQRTKAALSDSVARSTEREAATSARPQAGAKGKSNAALNPAPAAQIHEAARSERFVCRIHCKSANGPAIRREFTAATRRDAARQAGDAANQLCANAGHGNASSLTLPEGQCNSL